MIRTNIDRSRCLEELEGVAREKPSHDSYLVATCHRLRTKPVKDFTVEDLRIMLGQGIGVDLLAPLALEVLSNEPLAQGDFYPGDLLASVLRLAPEFWRDNPEAALSIEQLLSTLGDKPEGVTEAELAFRKAIEKRG